LTVGVPRVVAGQTARATVRLAHPAPAGGLLVAVSSSDGGAVGVPAEVRVTAGSWTAELTIRTSRSSREGSVQIQATVGRMHRSATITLVRTAMVALEVPAEIVAGDSAEGRITLSDPAPEGGVVVALSSSDRNLMLPSQVAFGAGETVATFTLHSEPVPAEIDVQVTAEQGDRRMAVVRLRPAQQPMLASLVATPDRIAAGETTTVTVGLAAPAPGEGALVILSADADGAVLPSALHIPAGDRSATFEVTAPQTGATSMVVSATVGTNTRTVRISLDGKRRPSRGAAVAGHAVPISLGVTGAFVTPRFGTLSMSTAHRYSFYTPEMSLMSETTLTTSSTPAIAYDYIWFAGKPVAQVDVATSTAHWTFTDHLGTPLIQTNAGATIDWRVEHEPYGKVYEYRVGATRHQPLRFPGQEYDDSSPEREYNISRWYREGWGSYTQGDLLVAGDISSLYRYAESNPLSGVDPLGNLCTSRIDAVKNVV
jgi:RHS repeat-associated protein